MTRRLITLRTSSVEGIVKEVVKITEQPKTDHGRKIFIGVEQFDSPYMGLDIRTIFHTPAKL